MLRAPMGVRGPEPNHIRVLEARWYNTGSSDPVSPTVVPYSPAIAYASNNLTLVATYADATVGALKSSFFVSTAQIMRAVLFANATVTSIRGFRDSICSNHEPLGAPRLLA